MTRRGHWRGRVLWQLVAMGAVGLVVALIVGAAWSWWYAPVSGWVAACITYVVVVWSHVHRFDAAGTRAHATSEDPGRVWGFVLVVGAAIAAVIADAVLVVWGRDEHGASKAAIASLAFLGVALSWLLIHTLYTLRYAHAYYQASPPGGVDFNSDEPPAYSDFAYLSFTLGMTYQVSDTNLTSGRLRRMVLGHTLLSYAFGTLILASLVNLIIGL